MGISTVTAVPKMTSNTAPSGVASASTNHSSSQSFIAFDQNYALTSSAWTTNAVTTGWISYQFTKQIYIGKYAIYPQQGALTRAPKNWTFEGSNDGVNWVVLDTQVNQSDWVNSTKKEFIVSSPKIFTTYRLNISSNNGDSQYLSVGEFEMFEITYSDKFLIASEGETSSIVTGKKNNETSIPTMTSDTAPSGRAFAGSVYSASYASWKAFNGIDDVEGYASLNGTGGVGYLGYEFNDSISLYKYAVRSNGSGYLNRMPKDWTFEGSDDGTNWTVLDTQSNQIWETQYTDKTYLLDEHIHYMKFKMYRLNWTANNGFASYTDVNELKMFEVIAPKYIKLPSASEDIFVKYGMNKGETIDLVGSNSSVSIINIPPETLGSGKVFKQKIDTTKIPIKKASIT
ncbi:discoidin domain-containing protein [Paenibacillus amylolyticus]|uniref:discoidin domain-containing protein n=1 Tax=Paenibacillus amylolyticus TaxID=1451 RepID=UPI003D97A8F9